MNHAKMIQQFLAEKRDFADLPEYGFPFVTISRQAGAGGHLLSYIILTELLKSKENDLFQGWHVFDKVVDMSGNVPFKLVDLLQKAVILASDHG